MIRMTGYPINWAYPRDSAFKLHPLYIKYNNSRFGTIDANEVKNDLLNIVATAESASICAYLAWLIRTINLTTP